MTKKIIHITLGKVNQDRSNGVNKVLNSLLSHQVKNGLNVEFWGISFSNVHNYPVRNFKTHLFLDHKSKFKLDPLLKSAIKNLDRNNTICHIHGAFLPQLYSVSKLLAKSKIPYIFTPHGGYNIQALKKSKLLKIIYIKLFEKHLANGAKCIQLLGNSECIGTDLYFSNKHRIIPNGQELNKKSKLNNDSSTINVGFIGRIDIQTKGLDILLNGLKLVINKLDIKLQIIGSNGDLDELKKLTKVHGLTKNIEFLGAQYGDNKLVLMSNWDALCLTSRNEGLPGVVLEAASIGVPCIISHETNMGDYVKRYEAGWVLEKNTPQNIAQSFLNLQDSKKHDRHKNYGDSAHNMIKKEFDWNSIVKQLSKMYEE